jgi:hydrogenase maturation protein HypF
MEVAEEIRVRGTVQGVGFRPTVCRLGKICGLRGEVCNDGEGILIRASGTAAALDRFVQHLQDECPPLARIEAIARSPLPRPSLYNDFVITQSITSPVRTEIAPDAATCPQCLADTLDPSSRWYRYPFTNCTHCGPRLSIIRAIPYDRYNTSMAAFPMCPQCTKEYEDITNRRFHAQPVACPICGPKAWLERSNGTPIGTNRDAMMDDGDLACVLLQQGEIVAIKGIGGIHLACDATNEAAVQALRQRKHRYDKPFALMARDLSIIKQYCIVTLQERQLLQSPAAPIVLLTRMAGDSITVPLPIAPAVAPNLNTLGFMLPYTPLHHLILRRMNRPIVLTSGNPSDEPQCIDNQDARERLGAIADYLLLHNRAIVNRIDDSVVRVMDDHVQVLRRARGYAPASIRLPAGFEHAPTVLAMGSELKNTICLLQDGRAIVSQHLGDLENATAFAAYQETLKRYLHLFEHRPEAIALDLHPDYLSTKLGQELAANLGHGTAMPLHRIQHHHAHVAACMAENGISLDAPPVLGIALDGLGYGEDGTLWGGEFLWVDYCHYQRLGTFKPIAMLGGEQAIYQPWRNTYTHLMAAFDWDELQTTYGSLELIQFLAQQPRSLLNQMLVKGINTPLASSAGRLFDAVAAAVGINRSNINYEGQAAIQLEALIQPEHLQRAQTSAYPFILQPIPQSHGELLSCLEPRPMWQALLADLQQSISPPQIAACFHVGLANVIAHLVNHLHNHYSFTHVALTGGVFQNKILTQLVSQRLNPMNLTVLIHHLVPSNDGGLSLGQAAIAAARTLNNGFNHAQP